MSTYIKHILTDNTLTDLFCRLTLRVLLTVEGGSRRVPLFPVAPFTFKQPTGMNEVRNVPWLRSGALTRWTRGDDSKQTVLLESNRCVASVLPSACSHCPRPPRVTLSSDWWEHLEIIELGEREIFQVCVNLCHLQNKLSSLSLLHFD